MKHYRHRGKKEKLEAEIQSGAGGRRRRRRRGHFPPSFSFLPCQRRSFPDGRAGGREGGEEAFFVVARFLPALAGTYIFFPQSTRIIGFYGPFLPLFHSFVLFAFQRRDEGGSRWPCNNSAFWREEKENSKSRLRQKEEIVQSCKLGWVRQKGSERGRVGG